MFNVEVYNEEKVVSMSFVIHDAYLTGTAGYSHMRDRLEPDQPESVSSSTYKNWSKLSKKNFKV